MKGEDIKSHKILDAGGGIAERREKSSNANETRKVSDGVQLVILLLGQPEAIGPAGCETSSLNAGGDVCMREQG